MSLAARVSQVLKGRTAQNLLALYGVQLANYLLPLLTIPYLARVLGPEGFGKLTLAQALAQYLFWVLEYGFMFSATREVARVRDNPKRLGEIIAGVLQARLFLLTPVAGLTFLLAYLIPTLKGEWGLVFGVFIFAVGSSFNFVWFFQGLERMRVVSIIEIGGRILATFGIFLFIKKPEDVALPLYLQALSFFLTNGLGFYWAIKAVHWPGLSGGGVWLQKGFGLFAYNVGAALYANVNLVTASFLLSPIQMGHYAAAEKVVRVLINLWVPIGRLFFPKLSFEITRNLAGSRRWMLYGGLATLSIGLLAAFTLFVFAPFITSFLFGSGYEEVASLIKTMAPFLILSAASGFLSQQVVLPLGLDRALLWGILWAGVWNAVLAVYAVPRWGPWGLAWVMVIGEAWVLGIMLWILLFRQSFFSKEKK